MPAPLLLRAQEKGKNWEPVCCPDCDYDINYPGAYAIIKVDGRRVAPPRAGN